MSSPKDEVAPSSAEIVDALMRLFYTVRRKQYGSIGESELSGPRLRLLSVLADGQPLRMGDVAARMGLNARTITTLVDGLEQEGLLARQPDPSDRRAILLAPTEAGAAFNARARSGMSEMAENIMSPLSPEEQSQFFAMVNRLQAASGGWCSPECPGEDKTK